MERLRNITIIFLLSIGMLGTVTFAKSSGTLLQEGLYAEQVDGNLEAAIKIYEKIIEDSSSQRSHIAQAMYRLGMCYLKRQNEPKAKEIFRKLVANYSDQTKVVNKVKPLLEELGNEDPAALMPPETLIYIEAGSPGRQIETILNMLKGTPFENPLAALSRGKSQKSSGDMMAALFNPSMMAEFKKIRGMGIGVTGIAQNNPPLIAVLYPGESDALRGIILAALGMVAQPGEPIEGMDTLCIQNIAGIAYDDRVVIIAQPIEQLIWSVKQYKGVTKEPTLASTNKSFVKVSKKARQENALTIWASVDEVFAGLSEIIPKEHFHKKIRMADGIADFKNIDDLIVFLNIREDGIALEMNIVFKDGHNCVAYKMVRTPNLSKTGFEAVPSEAIGLLSISLGEAGSAQSMVASKSIKSLTGIDIGREIFANIEQISLFVLPPDSSANKSNIAVPPPVSNIGLAITSHNPQQTRLLLTQLLTVANLVTGQTDVGKTGQSTGKYQIALINNQKLYCYMNQINKTTVLSLNPDIVESLVSAIKKRRSVCTVGPLSEAVNKLSPSTSKMVLVNVGGAILVADAFLTATYNNPKNPAHKTIAELAKACDKTSIQFVTDERINNLKVRLSLDQLPSLDILFPMLMWLSQTDLTQKAVTTKPEPRNGATVGITTVSKLKWKSGVNAKLHKIYFGTQADQLRLLAEIKGSSYAELPHLEQGSRYYWRVDEVWTDGTVITGDVWSFTTGSLVALWKLDETSGNIAKDSSGNNNGTLFGYPQWQPSSGKIGGALAFDGDGDFIDCGHDEGLNLTGAVTIAAWIKLSKSTADQKIAGNQDNISGGYKLGIFSDKAEFEIRDSGNASRHNRFVDGGTILQPGVWYHIVGTYSQGGSIKTYVNAKLDREQETTNILTASSGPLKIGCEPFYDACHFNGLMDEISIYNYALSKEEITALYNEGK